MSESHFSRSSESEAAGAPPESRRMLVWPWVALIVAAGLFIAYWMNGPGHSGREGSGAEHPAVGVRLAEFDLQPLTGNPQPFSAADFEGKVTLVNFWGPWCGPCHMEFPHLMDIADHHQSHPDFQLVSVSCPFDPSDESGLKQETAAFLKDKRPDLPTYHDPARQTREYLVEQAKLAGFVFPTTLVVDNTGTIRGLWAGYLPGDELAVNEVLEALERDVPGS
jgi:thiol-disulfide isomerase/thioredoxin